MNVRDLKALARERKIKGYYNLRKAELIGMLNDAPVVSRPRVASSKQALTPRPVPAPRPINNSRLPFKPSKQNILKSPSSMNVKQLKALARERGIKGYSAVDRNGE